MIATASLVTFAVCFAIIYGLYWFVIVRPEVQEQAALRRRLRVAPKRLGGPSNLVKQVRRLSALAPMQVALQRAPRVAGPLQRLITQAGMQVTVGALLLMSGCLFAGVWLLVARVSKLEWAGLVAGILVSFVPYLFVKYRAQKRVLLFEEQFPEAIDLIARALRAGHAFTTGLAMVAEEATDPVAGEFRLLYDQQNFGMPMPEALRAFGERIPLLDSRFFVTAVMTQREAGGNLAEILDNLASVIRERFKVKRQVRVISAHGRITGWVLAGLPPTLALTFFVISPNHVKTLTDDPLGIKMILIAAALQITGTLIIRRLVDVEY